MLFSLEDTRIKSISEILGSKTSKKIIDFLSDVREASEKDISEKLKIPMNTVEYNLKKMIQAGIVEETKNFFWSQKGKKIKMYRFANKSIVISPKSKIISSEIKQIIPVALISGIAAVGLKYYFNIRSKVQDSESVALYAMQKTAETGNVINTENYWFLFLSGALFAIIALIILKIAMYSLSTGWKSDYAYASRGTEK